MNSKLLIKSLLGELPFTAEVYWLIRHQDKKLHSRFNLEALATRLPEMVAQVAPYAKSAPRGKKVFIFASLHFWIRHTAITGLALRALGHEVTLGYLPYGDYSKPMNRFDLRQNNQYANSVLKAARPLLEPVSFLDLKSAQKIPSELEKNVDQVTFVDAQYILQREDVKGDEPIFVLRQARNLEAARKAYLYFQEHRPDVVIIPNGMIQEFGAVYETARFLKIPTVTYEFGEQDQRIWLSQDRPVMYFESFNDLWKSRKDRILNEEERAWLMDFMGARQRLNKADNFAHLWQQADREGGARMKAALGLDDRPVVLLPTNVLGDTATLRRAIFSSSMTDWIQQVVPFFAKKPQIQLLVRIHPAEASSVGPSIGEIIRRVLPEIPENIRLIGPKEKVNTYDLMEIADLALVYTTTAGMEMATRGIPVMVSGKAPYRGRGFTIDAETWEQYFQKLEDALANLPAYRLSQAQIEKAWSYAYAFFHEFTHPFPWHLEKILAGLEKRPLSYVCGPDGRKEFEATFQELAGEPIDW